MKIKFKRPKSQLDEMQEQDLQKIGHNGFHLAFWGLFLSVLVQTALDADVRQITGEYMLLVVLGIYASVASFRKGLWSRYFKPGLTYYFGYSLSLGIIIGLYIFVLSIRFGAIWTPLIDAAVWFGGSAFFSFLLMFALGNLFKYRARKLEEVEDE